MFFNSLSIFNHFLKGLCFKNLDFLDKQTLPFLSKYFICHCYTSWSHIISVFLTVLTLSVYWTVIISGFIFFFTILYIVGNIFLTINFKHFDFIKWFDLNSNSKSLCETLSVKDFLANFLLILINSQLSSFFTTSCLFYFIVNTSIIMT